MREVTFTRKITLSDPSGTYEKLEVDGEVSAVVSLGSTPGGLPDPDSVEEMSVFLDGEDITESLSVGVIEHLEDEAVDVRRDQLHEAMTKLDDLSDDDS